MDGLPCRLVTIQDITELRRMEKELARLDKLNLVGEMAASIGHEVRNPMTTVRGFLQILGGKEKYSEEKEYFDLMAEEIDRANSIITEYLSLARDKTVDLKPGYLNAILRVLQPLIQADASYTDKQIKLDLGLPPKLLFDEKEIRQLILNLARNGLEAMQPGGTLTIGTRQEKNESILFVKDEGHGLDIDLMEKLGTPFVTTKENGTGLGLAVCYSIAARHNARIEVATGLNGTTFSVRFNSIGNKASNVKKKARGS